MIGFIIGYITGAIVTGAAAIFAYSKTIDQE